MVVHVYDLAVIGDHLGGLAAAALSAKRGKRVLVFEDTGNVVEGRPMEYLNAISGGPEREAGLGRFFHELGLSPFGPLGDDRIHFKALHPPLQVVLPGHRVNVYQDNVARNWEMEREFGDVLGPLGAIQQREEALRERLFRFRARSPGRGGSPALRTVRDTTRYFRFRGLSREAERESFARFLSSSGLPPPMADVLAGQVYGITRVLPSSLPWYVGMRSIQVLQGGLFQNASGQSGILNGLKEALVRFGVECRPLSVLEGIESRRTEEVSLHLAAGGRVSAGHVVVDIPLARALDRFQPEEAGLLQKKGVDRVEEEQGYGLMSFRIKQGWRLECMGRYLALDPSSGEGRAPAAVILLAGEPGDSREEKGSFGMEALAVFPASTGPDERRQAMWNRFKELMPFLERSVEGSPRFQAGVLSRYAPQNRGWRTVESYYRTGRRPSFFQVPGLTFLRNEDYLVTGLAEGLLSGIQAVS
jgi:hypothetical protein